jgi:hypothetical protein
MCGNYTAPPSSTAAHSVLVIGDSISMAVPYTPGGYGVPLQRILAGHNVAVNHAGGWFIGGQCSNTAKGMECTSDEGYGYMNFTVSWRESSTWGAALGRCRGRACATQHQPPPPPVGSGAGTNCAQVTGLRFE